MSVSLSKLINLEQEIDSYAKSIDKEGLAKTLTRNLQKQKTRQSVHRSESWRMC